MIKSASARANQNARLLDPTGKTAQHGADGLMIFSFDINHMNINEYKSIANLRIRSFVSYSLFVDN